MKPKVLSFCDADIEKKHLLYGLCDIKKDMCDLRKDTYPMLQNRITDLIFPITETMLKGVPHSGFLLCSVP